MAESRTNVTEASENIISKCIDKKNVEVRVTAVEVPVSSIPVGSLINVGTGETYNLISSEQIQVIIYFSDFCKPSYSKYNMLYVHMYIIRFKL